MVRLPAPCAGREPPGLFARLFGVAALAPTLMAKFVLPSAGRSAPWPVGAFPHGLGAAHARLATGAGAFGFGGGRENDVPCGVGVGRALSNVGGSRRASWEPGPRDPGLVPPGEGEPLTSKLPIACAGGMPCPPTAPWEWEPAGSCRPPRPGPSHGAAMVPCWRRAPILRGAPPRPKPPRAPSPGPADERPDLWLLLAPGPCGRPARRSPLPAARPANADLAWRCLAMAACESQHR